MSTSRFLTLLLTLALVLATAPAVMAQEEEAVFDPANVAEFNEDEALILYGQLREALVEMGVPIEELGAAIDFLDGEFLSQAGDDPDDDEFGQAEEDEPELGDDEAGDSDD